MPSGGSDHRLVQRLRKFLRQLDAHQRKRESATLLIKAATELQKMEAVIEAAKCIRHWHDRKPDGMIVSAEHVRKLWAALHDLEANVNPENNE